MLITEAPCSMARAMPVTEFAQRISSSGSERDVELAHAGPDAEDAAVVLGRAGDGAVSVPCALSIGKPPSVERWPPWNSGWLTSAVASTSASIGLVSVTGGGTRLGSTIAARHAALASSGSGGGTCMRCSSRSGSA